MARTKNRKRNIRADITAVIVLGLWAYFADRIIAAAQMEAISYPLIGDMIAGVVPVSKVWVFLIGVIFYLLTSTLSWSGFIGWLGAMIVMAGIMLARPLQKLRELSEALKALKDSSGGSLSLEDPSVRAAAENYGIFPWKSDAVWVRLLTYITALLMAFMLVYFIVTVIRDRNAKNTTRRIIRNAIILLGVTAGLVFIPGLIMKTGPQWLFLAFMTFLAFVTYMYGVIKRSVKGTPAAAAAVTIVLMLAMSVLDMCYRMGFGSMVL